MECRNVKAKKERINLNSVVWDELNFDKLKNVKF